MKTVVELARNSLRRMLRDRTAMIFVVVLPVLVVVIVGATVTGFDTFRTALVVEGTGPQTDALVSALRDDPALEVKRMDSVTEAGDAVRRSEQAIGVVIPADFDADLRAGAATHVELIGDRSSNTFLAAENAVQSVVAEQAGVAQAARFAQTHAGGSAAEQLDRARKVAGTIEPVAVRTRSVEAGGNMLPQGFSYSAPTMLVLFVFINALAGGAAIIESRRAGLYERIATAPLRRGQIVLGEVMAYLSIALLQSLLIVTVGAVAFGVDWGSPVAAALLIGLWALVGTGAGVLSGTLFRTPEQASSVGPPVGIVAGMLGGCMWPLEIVPDAMRVAGHALPHAWAVDAWTDLLARHGGVADIAPQLAVLAGFATLLLVVASVRLRSHLTVQP